MAYKFYKTCKTKEVELTYFNVNIRMIMTYMYIFILIIVQSS